MPFELSGGGKQRRSGAGTDPIKSLTASWGTHKPADAVRFSVAAVLLAWVAVHAPGAHGGLALLRVRAGSWGHGQSSATSLAHIIVGHATDKDLRVAVLTRLTRSTRNDRVTVVDPLRASTPPLAADLAVTTCPGPVIDGGRDQAAFRAVELAAGVGHSYTITYVRAQEGTVAHLAG